MRQQFRTAAAGTKLAGAYSSDNVRSSSLRKGVYDPQTFLLHAALLHQAFAHCEKFLTAASRRSLGRVSVPVWLIILSDQLLIVALGGFYPHQLANQPQAPLLARFSAFTPQLYGVLASVSQCYPPPKGRFLRVTHPSATRKNPKTFSVRLACVRHAASVHPEPGSNSPLIIFFDFFEHTSYVVKKLKEFFDNTHSVLKNTHSVFKPLLSFFLLFKKSTKIIQRFRFLIRFFLKNLCFFLIKTNLMFWCFFY